MVADERAVFAGEVGELGFGFAFVGDGGVVVTDGERRASPRTLRFLDRDSSESGR